MTLNPSTTTSFARLEYAFFKAATELRDLDEALKTEWTREREAAAKFLANVVEGLRPVLDLLSSLERVDDVTFRGLLVERRGARFLFVLVDGTFMAWDPEAREPQETLTPEQVVAGRWSIEKIVTALCPAIGTQDEGLSKATRRARRARTTLDAISTLLDYSKAG